MLALGLLACTGRTQTRRVVEISPNLPGSEDDGTWDGGFEPDGACPPPTFAVLIDCDGAFTCADDSGFTTTFPPVCPILVEPPPAGSEPDANAINAGGGNDWVCPSGDVACGPAVDAGDDPTVGEGAADASGGDEPACGPGYAVELGMPDACTPVTR